MPKRTDIKSILIIGAGPIIIGQACEFDYSGAQACKALKEEGYRIILVNSNPATIMTDPIMADATYIEPIEKNTIHEIIKIEKPGVGDEIRLSNPQWGEQSVSFSLLNRGKKSLSLDLKEPKNLKILIPILKEADIIIEQFRPGVMKRLGLDYESIKKINQDIIYVSITGYGQYGPKSMVAGHDLNYIGNAGLLSVSMGRENDTVVPPALVADIAGGSYPAVINILLALRKRDLNKEGSYIDLSMTENLFPFMFWGLGSGFAHNKWPGNSDGVLSGGSPRYNIYKTSDGSYVAAAPLEDRFWKKFVRQ